MSNLIFRCRARVNVRAMTPLGLEASLEHHRSGLSFVRKPPRCRGWDSANGLTPTAISRSI